MKKKGEYIKTANFMLILCSTAIKEYKNREFYSIADIRVNGKPLNHEIKIFVETTGGLNKLYNCFKDAYILKENHINIVHRYVHKFKVQPHKLRMQGSISINTVKIVYEFNEVEFGGKA